MAEQNLKTSLKKEFPQLSNEWHPYKNGDLTPGMVLPGSNKKVWWLCPKGHEYQSIIASRALKKYNCPYCSNQKLLSGYNDLATTNPELLSEWDFEKNTSFGPSQIQPGSEKKAWWICKNNHSYLMQIDLKAKRGHGCPLCSKGRHTSFPESCVAFYVSQCNHNIVRNYKDIEHGISEIDVFIPSLNIGVEYDGAHWHNDSKLNNDINKNKACQLNGIRLFRIRENGCAIISDSYSYDIYISPERISDLNKAIEKVIIEIFNKSIRVDVTADETAIYSYMDLTFVKNSAINLPKEVLEEWNYKKNGKLNPEQLANYTHKSIWWKCTKCGAEYKARIANRANGRGCPYCSGHKLLTGFNDLFTVNPKLCEEWNYERNDLAPSMVTSHSGMQVWWKCSKGHEYKAKVSNRNDLNRGCPICAKKIIVPGINDLATLHPFLIKEWDFEKNTISPDKIAPGTAKKAYWKCHSCGYEWMATVLSRTSKNANCPKCALMKKGEHLKKVICQYSQDGDLIREYESLDEASKLLGVTKSGICHALKGKSKTCNGYIWKYK